MFLQVAIVLVSYIETLLALVCGYSQVNSVFCKDKLLGWHNFFLQTATATGLTGVLLALI